MTDETDITEDTGRIDALRVQITKRRRLEELKGVAHLGIRWQAGPEDRLAVLEALAFADMAESQGGQFATRWKGKGGQWSGEVGRAELAQAAAAIGQRRQAYFVRERELLDILEADPDAFDERLIGTGWPE